ncbi:hypothetical protein HDU81_008588 [Chytriomyces hyalinus]|nr:hypothetical protein HDU81_008588 [Chytriomyces hyalinus]
MMIQPDDNIDDDGDDDDNKEEEEEEEEEEEGNDGGDLLLGDVVAVETLLSTRKVKFAQDPTILGSPTNK